MSLLRRSTPTENLARSRGRLAGLANDAANRAADATDEVQQAAWAQTSAESTAAAAEYDYEFGSEITPIEPKPLRRWRR